MTKKVDNFFTVIVVTGDGSELAVEPPVEHTALQHPLVVIHSMLATDLPVSSLMKK